jgi:uncharacterized protein (TIGR03437 family)
LYLEQSTNQNNGSVRLFAKPQGLAPGTYNAIVVIDAGPLAGSQNIPVSLTVQAAPVLPSSPTSAPGATGGSTPAPAPSTPAAPAQPAVVISQVVNAATFTATPLVAGSLGTLMGTNLGGKNVSVTFDGAPATVLYSSAQQINLRVPEVGSKNSASVVVTVDGNSSAPQTVALAPAWPGIFQHGVLNQDGTENTALAPAAVGNILQIFATGIPANATVSVQIGNNKDLVPVYAGAAPTVPGVQQVNVAVPDGVAGPAPLVVCATVGSQQYCSAVFSLSAE